MQTASFTAPAPIPALPDPEDFDQRGLHWCLALSALQEKLIADIEHMAQNSHAIDKAELIEEVKAHFSDINAAVMGACAAAADRIEDERYDGCPRGPMFRRRG